AACVDPSIHAITWVIALSCSVVHEVADGLRFVMHAEAIDDGRARFVQAQHLDLGAFAAEFEHHLVQCRDGCDVPEMRLAEVDGNPGNDFLEIERGGELVRGAEEHLANHPVGAVFAVGIQLRVDTQVMPNLVGEEQRGQQHAGQYAIGEVVGEDHDHHGHYHDDIGGKRVAPQVADRIPAEGADGHHDHHRHQRGHGDLPDPVAEEDHHQQ